MNEEWRDIPGWECLYQVSDQGRVRSVDRIIPYKGKTRFLRGRIRVARPKDDYGHLQVLLYRETVWKMMSIHRLVLLAFVGEPPDGMECCHNDGNPSNNALSNLRWDTKSANQRDRLAHGTHHEANKTHCIHGHPFDKANTYVTSRGKRICRECQRARGRARWARQREVSA